MVRLLILTSQRRSEVAGLDRGWIHEVQRAVEIPAVSYMTKRPHVFPLSAPAWTLVEALPKWNGGDFIFTTTGGSVRNRLGEMCTAKLIHGDSGLGYRLTQSGYQAELGEIRPHLS
ncbi:hypothetical protein EB810_13385 [Altererythrobacter sp. FM1]|nr:hypothetical protein EB810_13385 [Altererythrobacter sp. FM1]